MQAMQTDRAEFKDKNSEKTFKGERERNIQSVYGFIGKRNQRKTMPTTGKYGDK